MCYFTRLYGLGLFIVARAVALTEEADYDGALCAICDFLPKYFAERGLCFLYVNLVNVHFHDDGFPVVAFVVIITLVFLVLVIFLLLLNEQLPLLFLLLLICFTMS